MRPFYAIYVSLVSDGQPGQGEELQLPSPINSHYLGGVAHEERYYLHSAFHTRAGYGRSLWAFELSALSKARPIDHDNLESVFGPEVFRLGEFMPSSTGSEKLLADAEHTPWRGIGAVGDVLDLQVRGSTIIALVASKARHSLVFMELRQQEGVKNLAVTRRIDLAHLGADVLFDRIVQ